MDAGPLPDALEGQGLLVVGTRHIALLVIGHSERCLNQ